jgi:hypothetical protein
MQLGSTIENIVRNEVGGGTSRSVVNLDIHSKKSVEEIVQGEKGRTLQKGDP